MLIEKNAESPHHKMQEGQEPKMGSKPEENLCEDILSCISALDQVIAEYDDSLAGLSIVTPPEEKSSRIPVPISMATKISSSPSPGQGALAKGSLNSRPPEESTPHPHYNPPLASHFPNRRRRSNTPTKSHEHRQQQPPPKDFEIRTDCIRNTGQSIAYGIIFQPKVGSGSSSPPRIPPNSPVNPPQVKKGVVGGSYPKIRSKGGDVFNKALEEIKASEGSQSLKIPQEQILQNLISRNVIQNEGGDEEEEEEDEERMRERWDFSQAQRNLPRSLRRTRKKCLLEDDLAKITITTTIPDEPTPPKEEDEEPETLRVPSPHSPKLKGKNDHTRSKVFRANLAAQGSIYGPIQPKSPSPSRIFEENKLRTRGSALVGVGRPSGSPIPHLIDTVDDGYLSMVNREGGKVLWPEEFIENATFTTDELRRIGKEPMEEIKEEERVKVDYFSDDSLEVELPEEIVTVSGGHSNVLQGPMRPSPIPKPPVSMEIPWNLESPKSHNLPSVKVQSPWKSPPPNLIKNKIPKPERKSLKQKVQQTEQIQVPKPCSFFIPLESEEEKAFQEPHREEKRPSPKPTLIRSDTIILSQPSQSPLPCPDRETDIIEDLDESMEPPAFIPEPPPSKRNPPEECQAKSSSPQISPVDKNSSEPIKKLEDDIERSSMSSRGTGSASPRAPEVEQKPFEEDVPISTPWNGTYNKREGNGMTRGGRRQVPIVDDEFAKQMKDISEITEMSFKFADETSHLRRFPQGGKVTSRSHENLLVTIELDDRPRSQQGFLSSTLPINCAPPVLGKKSRRNGGLSKMFDFLMKRKRSAEYTIKEESYTPAMSKVNSVSINDWPVSHRKSPKGSLDKEKTNLFRKLLFKSGK